MAADLVNAMVPVLGRSLDPQFNVFDVMHHGLHEKQVSNVFGWLLSREGTHGLGDRFVRIFVGAVNADPQTLEGLPVDDVYRVQQEVDTAGAKERPDIADLVLEGEESVLVIENYFTTDGHGHDYKRYLAHGAREGKRARVVLLCGKVQSHLLTNDWDQAAVVTYGSVIDRLYSELREDRAYSKAHPEAFAFIEQIHRKFTEGAGPVDDSNVLDFVVAMCATGEARRYQTTPVEAATKQFATDLAAQARERFGEGRDLLMEVKGRLRDFSATVLVGQLNDALGEGAAAKAVANLQGLYQWTIAFQGSSEASRAVAPLRIKFGPSAWAAVSSAEEWAGTPDSSEVDYRHLFVGNAETGVFRQSSVTLEEVLAGLDSQDTRLRDELVALLDA